MPTGCQNAEAFIDQAIGSAMAVPGTVSSHQLAAALRSVRQAFAALDAGDTEDPPQPTVENPVEEARIAAGFQPKISETELNKERLDLYGKSLAPESLSQPADPGHIAPPPYDPFDTGDVQPNDPDLIRDASSTVALGRSVGAPEVEEPQRGVPLSPDDPPSNIPPPAQPVVTSAVQPALQIDDVSPHPKAPGDVEDPTSLTP